MADFFISAIKLSSNGHYIEQVKVRKNAGQQMGPELLVDREFVADLITMSDLKFKTCIKSTKGWVAGADIYVTRGMYLVTDAHAPAKMNLHNLPRFQ